MCHVAYIFPCNKIWSLLSQITLSKQSYKSCSDLTLQFKAHTHIQYYPNSISYRKQDFIQKLNINRMCVGYTICWQIKYFNSRGSTNTAFASHSNPNSVMLCYFPAHGMPHTHPWSNMENVSKKRMNDSTQLLKEKHNGFYGISKKMIWNEKSACRHTSLYT